MLRGVVIFLLVLFLGLQFRLWFGENNVRDIWQLEAHIKLQQEINRDLERRNSELEAEVLDLKKGQAALEERARSELGMIKEGETFFQLVEPSQDKRRRD